MEFKTERELAEFLARLTTPIDGVEDENEADEIMAHLEDETLCGDATVLYDCIRAARKLVTK